MADLMRISGVGRQFAELLEASGVDTVKELKHRRAENLTARMAEVNIEKKLCRVSPGPSVVAKWIQQANSLEAAIRYLAATEGGGNSVLAGYHIPEGRPSGSAPREQTADCTHAAPARFAARLLTRKRLAACNRFRRSAERGSGERW